MKIYTRGGDKGETGLPGGDRLPKDAPVMQCCGTIDELNTALGLVRAGDLPPDLDALLGQLQNQLFELGAEVARCGATAGGAGPTIGAEHVHAVEQAIDRYEADLPPLRNFILPGGTPAAAGLHFARAVCRRGERELVSFCRAGHELSPQVMAYMNRVGDLMFVLARTANARANHPETIWRKEKA